MRNAVLRGILAAGLLAIGTGTTVAQQATELMPGFKVDSKLLADAQKEGKVVFWCSLREQECALTSNKFEELTKIKVEFVRLSTGPTITRLSQERAAGIHSVDVISHSDQGVWESIYKPKKWLVKYVPAGTRGYAPEFKDPDGTYFAHFLIANGIGFNKNGVPADQLPKKYTDLLDPKFKGKIVMPHPKHSGGTAETVAILAKMLGWKFFEGLKKNDILILVGSQFNLNPVVANGERQLALQATDAMFISDAAEGKPVGVIYPEEGTVVNAMYTGLVADAPHPNAGKLLLEWIHNAQLQTMIAASNWLMPNPDVNYPEGRTKLKDLKILSLSPHEAKDGIAKAQEKFSDLFGG